MQETNTPGHELVKTLRYHHHVMRRRFDRMGLHRGQPPLIMQLYKHDGLTHSELSEHLDVTPATVTNLVKRMERDGLVIRRRDADDERVSRVYLTEEGKSLRKRIISSIQDIEKGTFADFSEQEMSVLRNFIKRIEQNLKDMCKEQK